MILDYEIIKNYYHPDHLGSSSWITDRSGNAIQYLHYLPYGEEWIDQQSTSWNAPYTFTGKIKDAETGYNYFGARYYDSKLSVWLSVDPMSDKYPSMSPYNYCANNPVMLVDPDGRRIIIEFNGIKIEYKNGILYDLNGNEYLGTNKFANTIVNGLNEIKNKSAFGSLMIYFIEKSEKEVRVSETDINPSEECIPVKGTQDIDYISVKINPQGYPGMVRTYTRMGFPKDIASRDVVGDIAHEFSHVFDDVFPVNTFELTHRVDNLNGYEWLACFRENIIRKDLGKNLRSRYSSQFDENTGTFTGTGPQILDEHGNTRTDFLNN